MAADCYHFSCNQADPEGRFAIYRIGFSLMRRRVVLCDEAGRVELEPVIQPSTDDDKKQSSESTSVATTCNGNVTESKIDWSLSGWRIYRSTMATESNSNVNAPVTRLRFAYFRFIVRSIPIVTGILVIIGFNWLWNSLQQFVYQSRKSLFCRL